MFRSSARDTLNHVFLFQVVGICTGWKCLAFFWGFLLSFCIFRPICGFGGFILATLLRCTNSFVKHSGNLRLKIYTEILSKFPASTWACQAKNMSKLESLEANSIEKNLASNWVTGPVHRNTDLLKESLGNLKENHWFPCDSKECILNIFSTREMMAWCERWLLATLFLPGAPGGTRRNQLVDHVPAEAFLPLDVDWHGRCKFSENFLRIPVYFFGFLVSPTRPKFWQSSKTLPRRSNFSVAYSTYFALQPWEWLDQKEMFASWRKIQEMSVCLVHLARCVSSSIHFTIGLSKCCLKTKMADMSITTRFLLWILQARLLHIGYSSDVCQIFCQTLWQLETKQLHRNLEQISSIYLGVLSTKHDKIRISGG